MAATKPPLSFRATDEDRKVLAELMAWLGLAMPSVIRLALRRLHHEEQIRRGASR